MLKLAFFSPLGPQHSGIADYSEALLPYLAEMAEIHLFVDGFTPANQKITSRFRIFDYRNQPFHLNQLSSYDAVLYHIGNDRNYHEGIYNTALAHPGIVILHDFSLQGFFSELVKTREGAEMYLDELQAGAGQRERQKAEVFFALGKVPPHFNEPLKFPMNKRLVSQAEAVIVHSQWSLQNLEKIAPFTPIRQIPHLLFQEDEELSKFKQNSAHSQKQPKHKTDSCPRIASFGYMTPNKGFKRILQVLAKLRHNFDFRYSLVGEVAPDFEVEKLIRQLNLQNRVEITGRVSIEEFVKRISETDLAINLREQIGGETSGSLCRLLGAGITSIVSNAGWFAELPENCVVKIEMDESADALLETYLAKLLQDADLRAGIGRNAMEYMMQYHSIEDCAKRYLEVVKETILARPRKQLIQSVSKDIAELGIDEVIGNSFFRKIASEITNLASSEHPDNMMFC